MNPQIRDPRIKTLVEKGLFLLATESKFDQLRSFKKMLEKSSLPKHLWRLAIAAFASMM